MPCLGSSRQRNRCSSISLDHDPEDGIRTLARFKPFDEILAGGNWVNIGAFHYIWERLPGSASVPQIIVTSRRISQGRSGISYGDEEVLMRVIGADDIVKWSHSRRLQGLLPRAKTTTPSIG
jgi:hypothetical protein